MMHLTSRTAIPVIVLISFAVTLAELPPHDWLTLAAISLAAGVAALALMAASAVLGGRIKAIEALFGGLDRVYLAHKWIAIWALGFAALHFAFRAGMSSWDTAAILPLPPFYTRLVRQLSLLALVFILLLALNRNIPYHRWRWWHKLSGPLFLIVILHWLSYRSPIELVSPAGIWLFVLAVLGVSSAAYKLLLYRFVANHAEYKVVGITAAASALHLELAPVAKEIEFKPGQFGFISFKEDGLREPHPFTIARTEHGTLHFAVRDLGDYTHRLLQQTKEGMHADIYAPFGRFERRATERREVWIAGGVGISPFIAWLTDPAARTAAAATLFYFFTPGREFPSVARIRELAAPGGTHVVPVAAGPTDREFVQRFENIVAEVGPTQVDIAFCGPRGLLDAVKALCVRLGIPQANLRFENFEFR